MAPLPPPPAGPPTLPDPASGSVPIAAPEPAAIVLAEPSEPRASRMWVWAVVIGVIAWVAGFTGAVFGDQIAEWIDAPPNRSSDEPLDVAAPRDPVDRRVDVAAVANYIAPSVVTINADVEGGTSVGTGVIISSDGEIVTNAHVVEGAARIRVRLAGETEPREVSLLAADPGNDLALLRMSGDGFEAATFADPESVRLGDQVIAMGFALGLDGAPSVTLGIVSATERTIGSQDVYLDGLIQTDAAISSGNSGGPLVNAAGEVVGINTAVIRNTATTAASNVGFAISVKEALPIITALRERASGDDEARSEAYLGVSLEDRRDGGQGVLVASVEDGTPAEEFGLAQGDLIVAVDGAATDGSAGLIAAIRDHAPDDAVTVTVVRDGERITLDVQLTARPDS
jgi:putative serine protease PepD